MLPVLVETKGCPCLNENIGPIDCSDHAVRCEICAKHRATVDFIQHVVIPRITHEATEIVASGSRVNSPRHYSKHKPVCGDDTLRDFPPKLTFARCE